MEGIIDGNTCIFWFRRDLRLADNAGLYYALKENEKVQPVFIFDPLILDALDDRSDKRVEFIFESLMILKGQLEEWGSSILIVHDNPVDFFKSVSPKSVYTNHDYEPYARKRDSAIEKILAKGKIPFKSFKDQVVFEKDEILKDDGRPYTVFTPYSRKWKAMLDAFYLKSYPTERYFHNLNKTKPLKGPDLADLGFRRTNADFPPRIIKRSVIEKYHERRDIPSMEGTSRISVHLRFGTVSIRKLVALASKKNETWLNELIWREFYHMILWHFPEVGKSFKPAYDRIVWRNDEKEFTAWCEGKTGYPIVDAGMRELNETGFMHNRLRMITASFLVKHLLVDWRWGEAYFAKKLLDFDLAANNGGWQWVAGSGCDAAPYFRIFNPELQTRKFDPDLKYIKKWIPELGSEDYPSPIVDHPFARSRALRVFSDALKD